MEVVNNDGAMSMGDEPNLGVTMGEVLVGVISVVEEEAGAARSVSILLPSSLMPITL